MKCPKCGSENISIQTVQTGMKTKEKRRGILQSMIRFILIFCTLGLWLLVGRADRTTTKFKNSKRAVCQNCGRSWAA